MLFNSLEFAVFFSVVYGLYLCCNHRWQNTVLLVASYFFYGWWDWRLIPLLFIVTLLNYVCGYKINSSSEAKKKKLFIFLSILGNVSILGTFKYFNFFVDSLGVFLKTIGFTRVTSFHSSIIFPLGISFYTFKAMSYPLDIYMEKLAPTKKFSDFALFVSFFPGIVSGPIDRAKQFLSQILFRRVLSLEKIKEGCWLIFWGIFMKVYVADNLAKIADDVFAQTSFSNGAVALMATYAFTFQLFCDFAGYSNIAIGLAKCMGFELTVNFKTPLFATNPQEFWRRWHISLSNWFKDYVFIPLCALGKKSSRWKLYLSSFVTMVLIGLWHGPAWHYVLMGCYWGGLIILYDVLRKSNFKKMIASNSPQGRVIHLLKKCLAIVFFFQLVSVGMMLFRVESVHQACDMIVSFFTRFQFTAYAKVLGLQILWFISPVIIITFFEYKKDTINFIFSWNPWLRMYVYVFLLSFLIAGNLVGGVQLGRQFIYLQF